MVYITVRATERTHQISLEDILNGTGSVPWIVSRDRDKLITNTVTRKYDAVPEQIRFAFPVETAVRTLEGFIERHKDLYDAPRQSLYHSFKIPKKSGGMRQIDAPNDNLKAALRELQGIFSSWSSTLYHTSAFAYIPGRSAVESVQRHQANQSNWFLKTDFSNFFGNTTPDFVHRMAEMIYPFNLIMADDHGWEVLSKALNLCFLNGGLPQGTPISPWLTNVVMIPFDHMIANRLAKDGFVYTRYADDVLISNRRSFLYKDVIAQMTACLKELNAPYEIKPAKTRYGSRAGSNWNLGVMLNKDNNITIGHEAKKKMKAKCHDYIMSKRDHSPWPIEDLHSFNGLLAYYFEIEPEYTKHVIAWFNKKYAVNLVASIRADIKRGYM